MGRVKVALCTAGGGSVTAEGTSREPGSSGWKDIHPPGGGQLGGAGRAGLRGWEGAVPPTPEQFSFKWRMGPAVICLIKVNSVASL